MARKTISLPRVLPSAAEGQENLAKRVDLVIGELEQFLRNMEAADAAALGAVPAATALGNINTNLQLVQAVMSSVWVQSFDNPVESGWTQRVGDGSGITYPSNGSTGGKAFRAVGHKFFESPNDLAYDSGRLYRFRARARVITKDGDAGDDIFRCGFVGVHQDGSTIVDRNGGTNPTTAHNVGANHDFGAEPLSTWVNFVSYFGGAGSAGASSPSTDPLNAAVLHNNVAWVRPFFEVNADGGVGTFEIDYLAFDVITNADEILEFNGDLLLPEILNKKRAQALRTEMFVLGLL